QEPAQLTRSDRGRAGAEKRRLRTPTRTGNDIREPVRRRGCSRGACSIELPEIVDDIAVDDQQFAIFACRAFGVARHSYADGAAIVSPAVGNANLNDRICRRGHVDRWGISVPIDSVIITCRLRPVELL